MFAADLLAPAAGRVAARPACVVDARLLFSRLGVLVVARLSSQFGVWLPREARAILRDTRPYLREPAALLPRVYCAAVRELDAAADADATRQELEQWDRLPVNDALASLPLYHFGERADESATPPGLDCGARERCEQLQRGLDVLMVRSGYDLPRGGAFAACARDAAALCVALQCYGAFVLTRLESDAWGDPALCNYLGEWAATPERVRGGAAARPLRRTLARSGLAPLAWAGVPLAAVHIVLPGYPVVGPPDERLDADQTARLWEGARVFWYRL